MRYSKRAMPHEMKAAIHQGLSRRSRRWAYQAKVMNMLERARRAMDCRPGMEGFWQSGVDGQEWGEEGGVEVMAQMRE